MEYPYFSGPEPGFFGLWAAVSLRNLGRRSTRFNLPPALSVSILFYVLAIAASALLVWHSFWELPRYWTMILTQDALSKIYFWRWMNSFHFLRMTLLYLEGIAAFFIALWIFRQAPEKTVRFFYFSFLAIGILLIGYSSMELLIRGKQISVYPGFGPVFTDRNAYAAFWITYLPFALILIEQKQRLVRILGFLLSFASWLFCCLSLSVTGIIVIHFLLIIFALKYWYKGRIQLLKPGLAIPLTIVFFILIFGTFSIRESLLEPQTDQESSSNSNGYFENETLSGRLGFWVPAMGMIKEYPILGIGPGEAYKNSSDFRERYLGLPPSGKDQENPHNIFLQIATDGGLFTLAGFLMIIGLILFRAVKRSNGSADKNRNPEFSYPVRIGVPRSSLLHLKANQFRFCFVLSVVGLLLASFTQHPTIRFEFHILFWMFCGLIAGMSPPRDPGPAVKRFSLKTPAVIIVAAGFFLQSSVFPKKLPEYLEYGLRPIVWTGKKIIWPTERIAFLRTEYHDPNISFQIHKAQGISKQEAYIEINGQIFEEILGGTPRELTYENQNPEGRVFLGIITDKSADTNFAESWGSGIELHCERKMHRMRKF
jgi:O-antigen ligase